MPVPTPVLGNVVFELPAGVASESLQKAFGQLGAGLAIGAAAGMTARASERPQQNEHPRHGRRARLLVRDHLREERPQRHGHRPDVVGPGAERHLLRLGRPSDLLLGQHIAKRQVVRLEETIEDLPNVGIE